MDEIHANLQDKNSNSSSKNHVCPCAIVHEGHKEEFTKRKTLKNVKNFATSELNYRGLWDIIYDYVSKKYDLDKVRYLFVSGDGAPGIKAYDDVFPQAIYVLDPFHYSKTMKTIFKNDHKLYKLADGYIRQDKIEDFNKLVECQIEKYPEQQKAILDKQKYLLNNIEGIKNQKHEKYLCPCSMEGHVSNSYARYITSSPYGFSREGLENKLKLLVLKADKHTLTYDDFLQLKYGEDEYKKIIEHMNEMCDIKRDIKLSKNNTTIQKYACIDVPVPKFDSFSTQDFITNLIRERTI